MAMGNVKKIVLILVLVSLFIAGLVSIYSITKKSSTEQKSAEKVETVKPTESMEEKVNENSPVVQFEVSSTEIVSNKQSEMKIVFEKLPEPPPTAATLHLTYDPKVIKIDDISEGDLWTGVNVLERKIDNEKGDLKFSLGQGFEDKVTGKTTLAVLKITAVGNNISSSIKIEEDSAIASVGINKLIFLKGMPLKIEIK